ncbi:MAG: lamin tail domain-containing protein [Saprospiraceae bacterium]|nr:lamin tail domain-containing protein [Saprospiraceae bacterium]
MRHTLTLIGLFGLQFLCAQWHDRFSNGFDSAWIGDRSDFKINLQQELQLNAMDAGNSMLFHQIQKHDSMSWSFYFKMDFAPSATNKLLIILMADRTEYDSANAFVLEIGENGTNDNWKFYLKENASKILLGQGELAKLGGDPATARMLIHKYGDSIWSFSIDYFGGNQAIQERILNGVPSIKMDTCYFGLQCIYTDTRKDRFYFDDISVAPFRKDLIAPKVSSILVTSKNQLEIHFNEEIDSNSVKNFDQFNIIEIGNPIQIRYSKPDQILLFFDKQFIFGNSYVLIFQGIADYFGNFSIEDSIHFEARYSIIPGFLDLIISEFMADPTPVVGLPEKEFIEIKNRSKYELKLQNCSFSDGATEAFFPDIRIDPNSYLIVGSIKDTLAFKSFGNFIGLHNFPSINNTAEHLSLYNPNFELIHELFFDDSWYDSSIKKEGGYTLEIINSSNLCQDKSNWKASNHFSGGTPGVKNSMEITGEDLLGPELLEVFALSEWEIKLVFNESLHYTTQFRKTNFIISPSRAIATVDLLLPGKNEIIILLDEPLEKGIQYQLAIKELNDCFQNLNSLNSEFFALPVQASEGDLVWSEVLFDPYSGGNDFVEIYNKSDKVISTKQLMISNRDLGTTWTSLNAEKVILPNQYLAFTKDPSDLMKRYRFHDSLQIIATELPPMNDEGAHLYLGLNNFNHLVILDSVEFKSSWHHPFIHNVEGVSLEKIQMNLSSANQYNWQSAAVHFDYGTPGIANSQQLDTFIKQSDEHIRLSSKVISPNGDGYQDYLTLYFTLPKTGYKSRVEIFDLAGVKQKSLSYLVLAPNDFLIWNGEDDTGFRLNRANYIIQVELLHPDGDQFRIKERVVIDY